MKRTLIISVIIVACAITVLAVFNRATNKEDNSYLYVEVKQGLFEILVTTTGELQAESSTEIRGPEGLGGRNMRFRDINIQDLIPEGTIVKKGDYVATLDRSDADNNYKDELDELETEENEYAMMKLDTTLTLGDLRDDLINLKYNMEEAEITLEQSKYEPPTTIRQNRINLDKTSRAFEQAQKNYVLKEQQAMADVREAWFDLRKQRQTVSDMAELLTKFTVHAPAPGMVIYKREWGGEKRKVGSTISPWDPVVATLPDLSSMISKTYVNEIDISKVSQEQGVRITIDAFPEKSYSGIVQEVANIGEQLPNTDAKVFEVIIILNDNDPILRPSMTTGNQIVTNTFPDVLYVPLDCVHAGSDTIPFVYRKDGTRQVVILGESNENEIIVEEGLAQGDLLFLNIPEDGENFKLVGEDLIIKIREKARLEREETAKRIQENARERGENQRGMSPEMMERMRDMSPEELERMRSRMQQGGEGGQRGGERGNQQGGNREGGEREGSNQGPGNQKSVTSQESK